MKKLVAPCLLALAGLASQACCAQSRALDALGFRLGDDQASVKAALKTDMEPEPMASTATTPGMPDLNKGKTVLHLRTKGIWAFFNAAGKVETIRLDAPFAPSVSGLKLGDDLRKLTATLGQPIKKPWSVFLSMQRYQFALDDSAYVNFDLSDDGIQYIFITK